MLTFWLFGPAQEYATNRPTLAAQLNIYVLFVSATIAIRGIDQ